MSKLSIGFSSVENLVIFKIACPRITTNAIPNIMLKRDD